MDVRLRMWCRLGTPVYRPIRVGAGSHVAWVLEIYRLVKRRVGLRLVLEVMDVRRLSRSHRGIIVLLGIIVQMGSLVVSRLGIYRLGRRLVGLRPVLGVMDVLRDLILLRLGIRARLEVAV